MTESADRPVFIVSTSRSGSTLLRVLLDSHPDIYSPPETNLGRACEAGIRSWQSLANVSEGFTADRQSIDKLSKVLALPYNMATAFHGKKRWCEKSIDNIFVTDSILHVFPRAQFIFLYRDCLDFVVSGIEASKWGFRAYGFEDYVRASPGNVVEALIRYWCDCIEAALSFETRNPNSVLKCKYEDLVQSPEETISTILDFLELPRSADLHIAAFETNHELGAGDHKIIFSSKIDTDGLGRGSRIPQGAISPTLGSRMRSLMLKLDYDNPDRNVSTTGEGGNLPPAVDILIDAEWNQLGQKQNSNSVMVEVAFDDRAYSLYLDTNGDLCRGSRGHSLGSERIVFEEFDLFSRCLESSMLIGEFIRSGILRTTMSASGLAQTITAISDIRKQLEDRSVG